MSRIIQPQDGFQMRFASCEADIAIGGGSAGCGKTWCELFEAAKWTHVPGYNSIVFRRTQPEIRGQGGLWDQSLEIMPAFGGIPRMHRLEWIFPTKDPERPARVQFGSIEYDKDKLRHQGRSYALIQWDELTHFSEDVFWYLFRSLRSVSGVRPYTRATCNPDYDSFVRWLVDWWIGDDGYPIPERADVLRWFIRVEDSLVWADTEEELIDRYPDSVPRSFTFIPGSLEDNKILMREDPTYLANLEALPYVDRMQQLHGNWNIRPAAGNFFQREWFEVVETAPAETKKVRAWDKAGSDKKTSAYTAGALVSRAQNGLYFVEDIVRFQGRPLAVEEAIVNTASQDGHGVEIAIWQDPGQAGKTDIDNFVRLLAGYNVHGIPARESKETYAKPVSAQAERGNVKLVRGAWNEQYIHEHINFPEIKLKDQVDATSLAFLRLTKPKICFA